ncbi:hypothetical protein GCM10007939_07600 [Amylibacter marinus]|uniref:DUF2852 domain-containing protein n=1 Tax=Amylibacter marinus TaxID=1475483 RepID=A0ABQ5VT93_9RHOB|nr:DUF2852 domain-containing protein [Amylibacter marinus]GLQ34477.1 hypothetical protein GCM10007939_07600 [Amylibacter marinus]
MTSTISWYNAPIQWLDERGKGAWLVAMILGFIFIWPLGLAILFYMIWSKRMQNTFFKCRSSAHHKGSTGNSAFDAYKEDTINRLNEEQAAFNAFLQRLRSAKDKSEFDDFLDERAKEKTNVSDDAELVEPAK